MTLFQRETVWKNDFAVHIACEEQKENYFYKGDFP